MTNLGKVKVTWNRFTNKEGRIVTVSNVYDGSNSLIGEARTTQGKTENHNPNKGRMISLSRALRETTLTKEDRTQIWEDYRNMTAKPRW